MEMVRAAVNHMLAETGLPAHPHAFESRLTDLEGRLHSLTLTVASLKQASTQPSHDAHPDPHPFRQSASR